MELLHPIASRLTFDGCDRCAAGFETIFAAALTLFQQIVAGDNWGQISIPVVEEEPLTAILLFSMLITISLGMLNLILAATCQEVKPFYIFSLTGEGVAWECYDALF